MTGRAMWDPMRDDFNNSTYEEEEGNERGKLDHCKLYITNIPKVLNEDGLRAAFQRFGTLIETFLSRDPQKKYAIIRYETSSEAKLAMMKMNRTEPLKLSVSIAYKTKKNDRKETRQSEVNYEVNNRRENRHYDSYYEENNRDDNISVSSRSRNTRKDDRTNGSDVGENSLPLQDVIPSETMDPSLDLKLESLKLEQLKLREEQLMCKHRILMIQQAELAEKRQVQQSTAGNRCILPDGRIVVRNVSDRLLEARDGEPSYTATGAGDSLKIPGLQRVASRACVQCGEPAEAYCARCGLTPYCSQRCQRRDWAERHRAVCHNLARMAAAGDVVKNDGEDIPVPSSNASPRQVPPAKRDTARRDDPEPQTGDKNSVPLEPKAPFTSAPGYRPSARDPRANTTSPRTQETRRPPCQQTSYEQPDEDWRNANKVPPKQQQPEASSSNKNTPPTPQATSVSSSPSVKTERALRQPYKSEQRPVKQPARTQQNMKEPQPNIPPLLAVEVPKVVLPATNGVGSAPAQALVPKTYLIEELSIGDVILLSVDSDATECRANQPGRVCLSMHEKFEKDFDRLCADYAVDCETEAEHRPKPGEMFSYLNPDDGGWYRARGLTPTLAALVDSCKVVTVTPTDKCKKLPAKYRDIPEFACHLDAKDIEVGTNLKCTLLSRTADGLKVSLQDVETGNNLGEGVVKRWLPEVEHPVAASAGGIPEVCRPAVVNNSRVLLVDTTGADRLVVRPADTDTQKQFDRILQDVLVYGLRASPMTEPPSRGQTVVSKYTDDLHYRALCKRTNVKQNKYQLEYLEYGNIEVTTLEMLYTCPEHLNMDAVPTLASVVTLGLDIGSLTTSAEQYLESLKDEEMILSIPTGSKTAPSGSAVTLTLVKNNEVLNRRVEELCTPEWKKIEERGGDVIETERLMYDEMECSELPSAGCTLEILDDTLLSQGSVTGCELGLHHARHVFTKLTQQMGQYCNSVLGRDPYLPMLEELCIAQFPATGQWYRAVLLEQPDGPGGDKARVLYVDYGYMLMLPVTLLRKMLPEFVRGLPAVASHLDIRNFPENPTAEMVERARRHMKMTSAGRGQLKVSRCERQEENGFYTIDAPELIKAMYSA